MPRACARTYLETRHSEARLDPSRPVVMNSKDEAVVDIHTHILPDVDDGSGNLEESVEMLRIAHESSTRVMVATPHMFHPSFSIRTASEIRERFETLQEHLTGLGQTADHEFLQDVRILLGAENYWGPDFLEALSRRTVLPINSGRYVLVEFHPLTSAAPIRNAPTDVNSKILLIIGLILTT